MKKCILAIIKIIAALIICAVVIGAPFHAQAAPLYATPSTNIWQAPYWYTSSTVSGYLKDEDTYVITSISCTGVTVTSVEGLNTTTVTIYVTISGEGVHDVSCYFYRDPAPAYYHEWMSVQIDSVPPTITYRDLLPPPNGAGWNNTDATVTWECTDATSGVVSDTVSQTITTEGRNQSLTGTCVDKAGNTTSSTASGINIDKTAPTDVVLTSTGTLGRDGWFVGDVTIATTANENLSTPITCTGNQYQTSDTPGIGFYGSCINAANLHTPVAFIVVMRDATAPIINYVGSSPAPNSDGWYDGAITVTWSCNDATSGAVSDVVTQTVATEGKNQSVVGTCKDNAGNEVTDIQSGINIDLYPPTNVKLTATGPHVNSEWFTGPVTIKTTGSDISGVTCTFNQSRTINTTLAGTTFNGLCTDAVGRFTNANPIIVKIDMDPPTIVYTDQTTANANGWNSTNVIVTWNCADTLSGVISPTGSQTITTEGTGQKVVGICTDKAGNVIKADPVFVNVDKTPPQITYKGSIPPLDLEAGKSANTAVTFYWECSDPLSGVVEQLVPKVIDRPGEGQKVTGTCQDKAGNSISNTITGINIKSDDSQAYALGDGNSGTSNAIDEATRSAENTGSEGLFHNKDFSTLFYILGGLVLIVLVGWLIFFLKKK